MPRAQTRCGGIFCSEQGTGFPVILLHASWYDRHDFGPIIPDLAGARSARHGGRRARTGADRLGNSGHRQTGTLPISSPRISWAPPDGPERRTAPPGGNGG
jgi:hypothetical protein